MPVSATQVCLNVSQSIVCVNKSSFYIIPLCPNLLLDTELIALSHCATLLKFYNIQGKKYCVAN